MMMPRPPQRSSCPDGDPGDQTAQSAQAARAGAARKPLWFLDDAGKLEVVLVRTGAASATSTELIGAEALEGRKVVVREKVQ